MNEVTITPITVNPEPQPEISITLNLTRRDAEALRGLCRVIGGCPTNSPRRIFNLIDARLEEAGYKKNDSCFRDGEDQGVYFRDYKDFGKK